MSSNIESSSVYSYQGVSPRISDGVFIAETASIIGDVEICQGASIWFSSVICGDEGPIVIGNRSSLLDGAIVESGAQIAAGSVVGPGKQIPAGTLWGGCPARQMRELSADTVSALTRSARGHLIKSRRYLSGEVKRVANGL